MTEPTDNASLELTPVTPPASQPEPLLHKIFIGPLGMRAGWRFAIYMACFIALQIAISYILRPFFPLPSSPQSPRLRVFLLGECMALVAALIPAFFMARIEKRPFSSYGLHLDPGFKRLFWSGVLWGIAAITLLLVVMRGVGVFYFGGLALHGIHVLKFAAFWGVLFLVVGLFEEFVTRGYTQFTLTQGIGFWPAAILLSAAFGAIHLGNRGEAWIGALGAACIGLFFCLTLRRTGTLWFAIGMHASWDWGETFLYSVPDSGLIAPGHLLKSSFHGPDWLTGGSVGPEGSVLLFVIIAALWITFDRLYPEVKYDRAPEAPSTVIEGGI